MHLLASFLPQLMQLLHLVVHSFFSQVLQHALHSLCLHHLYFQVQPKFQLFPWLLKFALSFCSWNLTHQLLLPLFQTTFLDTLYHYLKFLQRQMLQSKNQDHLMIMSSFKKSFCEASHLMCHVMKFYQLYTLHQHLF